MVSKWDKYGRFSLDVASTATTLGFSAAKACTKFGFSVTREIASTAVGLTGTVVDHALFGGSIGAGPLLGGAVSTAISAVEFLALTPILLGESLTSTSLVAAHSSLSALTTIFPGSDEASFSLASFVGLVRREWNEPVEREGLPEERYGFAKILKALIGWATLQGVTSEWQEQCWFKHMREIHVNDEMEASAEMKDAGILGKDSQSLDSRVHITTDVIYPSHSGQIVTADIGEAPTAAPSAPPYRTSHFPTSLSSQQSQKLLYNGELKYTLRRLSKMVLAGYGGASLLFFGKLRSVEEAKLTHAVDASESEAAASAQGCSAANVDNSPGPGKSTYSWWEVLMGKHDHQIFLDSANLHADTTSRAPPPTALVGNENLMPRFWVLTDHSRREVVLVIRGTMSLNEIAVDLTCDPAPFELVLAGTRHSKSRSRSQPQPHVDLATDESQDHLWDDGFMDELESIPGSFPMDISTPYTLNATEHSQPASSSAPPHARKPSDDVTHLVHGGMLKMARAMGAPGKPVHVAVRDALRRNKGYSLVLCGHSLGAGVAGLLALMWASPETRLTHRASGLPSNRSVSAFLFAPPCLVSPQLGALAAGSGLITSFVYAHDVVSRLSLGSVRDLTRAAAWLCAAEGKGKDTEGEGYSTVTRRALKWKAGMRNTQYEDWFLATRTTLEANMHMTQLFPPGRVFWALRDGDLHPSHRLREEEKTKRGSEKVRLFEVLDVERVFGQIVFARDMLSSHMPHQYDRVLHELL
ncbi:hypothetical protein A0H81_08119 [Grifola frondosa]|uniref:sn-1-specific diacylglycerol lipase n=1 Tax=Grifola frondosa TaxID=5627 RepID=A0A1C7M622_GRIFR|nr:hypothetical protein A0H81_08119 [Grifola frondosa]